MRFNRLATLAALALIAAQTSLAADKVKVGFLSTLSGPGAGLGVDIRDGFNLAMKHLGGKLGGLPAEVHHRRRPAECRCRQADRRASFLKKDKVDFMTGIVFSNIMLAVGKPVFDSQTFYISANAGPSQLAGEDCNPYFFNVAWQNDNLHEAVGKYVNDQGFKNVVLVAPNYPGGKDAMTGFKRFYKGKVGRGDLHQARPARLRRRTRPDARRQARRRLLLPARRHGHQLRQAVRRRRPVEGHAPVRAPVSRPTRTSSRRSARRCSASSTPATGRTTSTTRRTRNSSPTSRRTTAACPRSTPRRATTRPC